MNSSQPPGGNLFIRYSRNKRAYSYENADLLTRLQVSLSGNAGILELFRCGKPGEKSPSRRQKGVGVLIFYCNDLKSRKVSKYALVDSCTKRPWKSDYQSQYAGLNRLCDVRIGGVNTIVPTFSRRGLDSVRLWRPFAI